MDERWTAHLASDFDGIASIVILIIVPGVFITAEVVARRRERAERASEPQEPNEPEEPDEPDSSVS